MPSSSENSVWRWRWTKESDIGRRDLSEPMAEGKPGDFARLRIPPARSSRLQETPPRIQEIDIYLGETPIYIREIAPDIQGTAPASSRPGKKPASSSMPATARAKRTNLRRSRKHHRPVQALAHPARLPPLARAERQPPLMPAHRLRPTLKLPVLAFLGFHLFTPKSNCGFPFESQTLSEPPGLEPRQQKPVILFLQVRQIPGCFKIRSPIRA